MEVLPRSVTISYSVIASGTSTVPKGYREDNGEQKKKRLRSDFEHSPRGWLALAIVQSYDATKTGIYLGMIEVYTGATNRLARLYTVFSKHRGDRLEN